MMFSELLTRCRGLGQHRCASRLDLWSPLFGDGNFYDFMSIQFTIAADLCRSIFFRLFVPVVAQFYSVPLPRCLGIYLNVKCEDFTTLFSCVCHKCQYDDDRSCPTTILRFAYVLNFEADLRCFYFGSRRIPLPTCGDYHSWTRPL